MGSDQNGCVVVMPPFLSLYSSPGSTYPSKTGPAGPTKAGGEFFSTSSADLLRASAIEAAPNFIRKAVPFFSPVASESIPSPPSPPLYRGGWKFPPLGAGQQFLAVYRRAQTGGPGRRDQ